MLWRTKVNTPLRPLLRNKYKTFYCSMQCLKHLDLTVQRSNHTKDHDSCGKTVKCYNKNEQHNVPFQGHIHTAVYTKSTRKKQKQKRCSLEWRLGLPSALTFSGVRGNFPLWVGLAEWYRESSWGGIYGKREGATHHGRWEGEKWPTQQPDTSWQYQL